MKLRYACLTSWAILFASCTVWANETTSTADPSAAVESSAAKDHATVEALLRLPDASLTAHPELKPAVLRYLSQRVGTPKYIEVAKRLNVTEQTAELTTMVTSAPNGNTAVEAARLLADSNQIEAIKELLVEKDVAKRSAAIRTIGLLNHPRTTPLLVNILKSSDNNLQTRTAAAQALGRFARGQKELLKLARAGEVPSALNFTVFNALASSNQEAIREAAKTDLTSPPASKDQPLPSVRELAGKRGNSESGKRVFNTTGTCNQCHIVNDQGREVGPNLSEIGSKLSREDMYVAILNPSAAISHNYETYSMLDADGLVTTGLLINQTDESVTIRNSEGVDVTRASEDVEQLKRQEVSLMPSDLQKNLSQKELVDLVEYLWLLRKPGSKAFIAEAADNQHDPSTAVAGFEIAEDCQVELFASEPMLLSPTSIDVDALGRIWVCEAVNYRHFRNTDNEERAEGDRILVLEDTDQDGIADKRTVFYQSPEIDSPHGVTVLGNKVIVSAGENVLVLEDTDGDLKADKSSKLFSGISGVQHDHGIHAFNVGPDGRLYFNFGNEGRQLKSATGESIVDRAGNVVADQRQPYQQGMVFRCYPDGSGLETLGWNFRNNWEVCVDSFGNLWQSDNDDDGNRGTRINFVMEFGNYGYRDELTGATWRAGRIGLESEIPLQHWHLNDPGVVPNILQTGAGSPTGMCFYEGDLLPKAFHNRMIHTDPGPNVVRAYPTEQVGAGYKASIQNLVKGIKDPWFRPVDVCVAPDGSLFVADWYDPGVGGHRMGDSKHGRIFRITPKGHKGYVVKQADLGTPEAAATALASPNLATQYLAQQALKNFGDEAITAIESALTNATNDRLAARLLWQHALLSDSPAKAINTAVKSDNEQMRILAVRIARQHEHQVLELIDQLKRDPSAHVRRELAIALRGQDSEQANNLWAALANQHDGQDRWYLEALGIGADGLWDQRFTSWLSLVGDDWNTERGRDIVWRCRSPKACKFLAEIIANTTDEKEQYRYFRAFDFHEGQPKIEALGTLVAN